MVVILIAISLCLKSIRFPNLAVRKTLGTGGAEKSTSRNNKAGYLFPLVWITQFLKEIRWMCPPVLCSSRHHPWILRRVSKKCCKGHQEILTKPIVVVTHANNNWARWLLSETVSDWEMLSDIFRSIEFFSCCQLTYYLLMLLSIDLL